MNKVIFILLAVIFLHLDSGAKPSIKSLRIGETWTEYATAHLEVEYYCESDLLLLKDSVMKSNYPLKDSIDAVSFITDLKSLIHKNCLIKNSEAKDENQQALDVISKKEHLPSGCFYIECTNGVCVYLGRMSALSDWFIYWDGVIYSVEQECADSFRDKYAAISLRKIREDIQNFVKEE